MCPILVSVMIACGLVQAVRDRDDTIRVEVMATGVTEKRSSRYHRSVHTTMPKVKKSNATLASVKVGTLNVLAIAKTGAGPGGHSNFDLVSEIQADGEIDAAKLQIYKNQWMKGTSSGLSVKGLMDWVTEKNVDILALQEVDDKTDIAGMLSDSGWEGLLLPEPYGSGDKVDYCWLLWKSTIADTFTAPTSCTSVPGTDKPGVDVTHGWFFVCDFTSKSGGKPLRVISGHAPSNGVTEALLTGINDVAVDTHLVVAMGDFNEPLPPKKAPPAYATTKAKLAHQYPEGAKTTCAAEFSFRKWGQSVENTGNFAGKAGESCETVKEWLKTCDEKDKDKLSGDYTAGNFCKYAKRVCCIKDGEENQCDSGYGDKQIDKAITVAAGTDAKTTEMKIGETIITAQSLETALGEFKDHWKTAPLRDHYKGIQCADEVCKTATAAGKHLIDTAKPAEKAEDFILSNVVQSSQEVLGCKEATETKQCPNAGWMSDHSMVIAEIPLA